MTQQIKNPTEILQSITLREIDRMDKLSKASGLNEKEVKTLETLVKIQKSLSTFETPEEKKSFSVEGLSDEELADLAG